MGEKKKPKTASGPLPRKINLPSGEWSFQIGRTGVNIRNPTLTKTTFVSYQDLFHMTPEEIERMKDNRTFTAKPSDIRDYIEGTLTKS